MSEYNVPNPNNYGVSNGVTVFVKKELSTNVFDDFLCLGNISEGNLSPGVEILKHYSNIFGINKQDKVATIKVEPVITVTFDELVKENFEYLLQSTRTAAQTYAVPYVRRPTFVAGALTLNDGTAIASVEAIKPLVGEDDYDEGATGDYTVALATGVVTLTASSTIGLTDQVVIIYTVTKTAAKYTMFDNTDIRGKLYVVNTGGKIGPNWCIYFPMVEIKPEGDIPLFNKSEWVTASMQFQALEDPDLGTAYVW